MIGRRRLERSAATQKPPGRDNPQISGYVDIHAHILPGIDDGPPDLEQSLEMARAAVKSGISTIAATPHLRSDFPAVLVEEIAEHCHSLRRELAERKIPLEVVSGAEVSLSWALEASDESLRMASYGQLGRDLLVESPATRIPGLDALLYSVRRKGYRLTLAHPERCPEFQRDEDVLRSLVDDGVLLQLNADSLLGPGRGTVKRLARRLLTEGLGHAIASDGHRGGSWRPVTRLSEAIDAAATLAGPDRADWMAREVPAAIVSGTAPSHAPPMARRRRPGWLFGHP